MPAYDFRCTECGHDFELRLSMSAYAEGEGRTCPQCASSQVERAWTAVNVIAGGSRASSPAPGCGSNGFSGFT